MFPKFYMGLMGFTLLDYAATMNRISQSLTSTPQKKVTGPLVSVVIPSLQEEAYLPYLLTSLQNQTYVDIEVVVVDSSDTEDARDVARSFGANALYFPPGNLSGARNHGAMNSTGDYLLFVDADCVMSPDYVELMVRAFEDPEVAMAHGKDLFYGENNAQLGYVYSLSRYFKPGDHTTRGIAVERNAFWELGGFDEALDPRLGYREDLAIGKKCVEVFGDRGLKYVPSAVIASPTRREEVAGYNSWTTVWGVRGTEKIDNPLRGD